MCRTNSPVSYSGDWTIEAWIKKTDSRTNGYLFGSFFSPPQIREDSFWGAGNLTLSRMGQFIASVKDGAEISGWRHVAFAHDALTMTLSPYLDGVPQGSIQLSASEDLIGIGTTGLVVGGSSSQTWPGLIDEFRIWSRVLSQAEIVAGMGGQVNAATIDVAITQVTTPVRLAHTFSPFSTNETVTVLVGNLSSSPLPSGTAIPLSYSFPGGSPVFETLILTQNLGRNKTISFTFATPADMSGVAVNSLSVSANFPGDLVAVNDTRTRFYSGPSAHVYDQFPHLETFDSTANPSTIPTAGWVQDPLDDPSTFADWGFVTSFGPQISADHTLGLPGVGYFFASGSGAGSPVSLLSPLFDLRLNSNPRLEFWLTSLEIAPPLSPDNLLSVDVIEHPSGNTTIDVFGPMGAHVGYLGWVRQVVDLSAFSGKVVELRFRGSMTLSLGNHRIAVDDVEVSDHPLGQGQVPQPGLAVFDLNQARSLGDELVDTFEEGPYFASAIPGGPLEFRFEGEANQPIILMFGSLNPVAATYPNIGQIDIGGLPDSMTGIPAGLDILFDGTSITGLNPWFQTNIDGLGALQLTTPQLPVGVLTTFQAAILNQTFGISLSNAIQLEIQ